eukprot:CAMPEP_0203753208 /NCGR_PEP_ID=MMETSP0098-20131031/7007_1 /ASSEMBLY_ACC=CAM_ASM_000208 /TAXON_ID=96639 /ORGANISM=" , Strain NY0313808BC1" /LENGTH=720 /DNA_ID=CAMNT_0050643701 /DNA_START=60 /DNA_END=2219 /DNA_ORIENTATION=+
MSGKLSQDTFPECGSNMGSLEEEELIVASSMDWKRQLTPRALLVGIMTGFLITFISLTIGLAGTGVVPGFSVTASLIGYAIMKPVTAISIRFWNKVHPFTKQENCIIQAIATSIQSLVSGLGCSSWLWALHENVAAQMDLGINDYDEFLAYKANHTEPLPNTIELTVGTMSAIAYLMAFTGVLIVTVFRKMYIIELALPFPSPTATAVMINSFFTETGRALAEAQLSSFGRWTVFSFTVSVFNWVFTRNNCASISKIPLFGIKAYSAGWSLNLGSYINFVGVGLILSPGTSFSIVFGAILSYGIVYPTIWAKGGTAEEAAAGTAWFDQDAYDMAGFYGYKVMFCMMILLADGLFALGLMSYVGVSSFLASRKKSNEVEAETSINETEMEREHRINIRCFTEDFIDNRWIGAAYVLVTIAGCIGLPLLLGIEWYMIMMSFLLTPVFALIGNYIAGLTDWNVTSNFAKAAVILFGAWGASVDPNTAIITSLICCGIVYCGASNSTDIIGDFKTGFLTRTSTRAMLYGQIVGFSLGCICTPLVFSMFIASTGDMGFTDSRYPNTYGVIYRAMASLAVGGGFEALPKNCLFISFILFGISITLPGLKLLVLSRIDEDKYPRLHYIINFFWISPMAAGIPFLVGTNFVLPVAIGLVVNEIWKFRDSEDHTNFHQVVAAALLVGPGLFSVPSIIFALAEIQPPLCMTFGQDSQIMGMGGVDINNLQ